MEWVGWSVEAALRVFPSLPNIPAIVEEIMFPRDYRHNFLDCDAWILFGQSIEGYLAALRPYAVYCADVIQRYVPQIFRTGDPVAQAQIWARQTKTFLSWRAARCVFVTTPHTRRDTVSYAGIPSGRVLLAPTLIDPPVGTAIGQSSAANQRTILWVSNASPHKNHAMGVAAARIYYEELDGTLPLAIVGTGTHMLNPASGSGMAGAEAFGAAPVVLKQTNFLGEVSDAVYMRLVQDAAVIWHNAIIDNGTFVAFDAARSNKHLVSSDYPQMRYLCDRYGIRPIWHPPDDPSVAAKALRLAEGRFESQKAPMHSLRQDTEAERLDGYGEVLRLLLSSTHA
jgi:glycosyltransferase involved in cell wall biosynthesis